MAGEGDFLSLSVAQAAAPPAAGRSELPPLGRAGPELGRGQSPGPEGSPAAAGCSPCSLPALRGSPRDRPRGSRASSLQMKVPWRPLGPGLREELLLHRVADVRGARPSQRRQLCVCSLRGRSLRGPRPPGRRAAGRRGPPLPAAPPCTLPAPRGQPSGMPGLREAGAPRGSRSGCRWGLPPPPAPVGVRMAKPGALGRGVGWRKRGSSRVPPRRVTAGARPEDTAGGERVSR